MSINDAREEVLLWLDRRQTYNWNAVVVDFNDFYFLSVGKGRIIYFSSEDDSVLAFNIPDVVG